MMGDWRSKTALQLAVSVHVLKQHVSKGLQNNSQNSQCIKGTQTSENRLW